MRGFIVIIALAAQAQPAQTPKAAAPIDLTGYWVSIVSEDWRYRMVTPTKGDFQGVPVTQDAVKVAEAWNPEADTAAGPNVRATVPPRSCACPAGCILRGTTTRH